jgi:hypothetical protein
MRRIGLAVVRSLSLSSPQDSTREDVSRLGVTSSLTSRGGPRIRRLARLIPTSKRSHCVGKQGV